MAFKTFQVHLVSTNSGGGGDKLLNKLPENYTFIHDFFVLHKSNWLNEVIKTSTNMCTREQHLGETREGTQKFKFNISNHRNFRVNFPMIFIYFYFLKNKFKSNNKQNLWNLI